MGKMTKKKMWALMRVQPWNSLSVLGVKLASVGPNDPCGFIAVFSSKQKAIKFAGNDGSKHIIQIEPL